MRMLHWTSTGNISAQWDEGNQTPEAIRALVEETYKYSLDDWDDEPIFWLALARAQWECGTLQPDVLVKVEEVVSSGRDLKRWDYAFDPRDRGRRQGVLTRFWRTLQKPITRPRNRPRKQRFTPI